MPSPLAGHAVNPSLEARWRHPCRQRSRKRRGHRTRKFAGCFVESPPAGRLAMGDVCRALHYPNSTRHDLLLTMHTDHLDWSLPAHRRGTVCGMDAAIEPPGTDSRRVPRWWAGKGLAARPQISRFAPDLSAVSRTQGNTPDAIETSNHAALRRDQLPKPKLSVSRAHGALAACRTCHESVPAGSLAARPASDEGTAPARWWVDE